MRTGSRLLRVVSIIMLVCYGIVFLGGVLLIAGFGASAFRPDPGDYTGEGSGFAALVVFLGIVICVGTILPFVAAILGIKYWKRPDKAIPCIVLGIIILVFSSLGALGLGLLGLAGLALSELYVMGAFQLKKMNTYGGPEGGLPAGYGVSPPADPDGVPLQDPGGYPG